MALDDFRYIPCTSLISLSGIPELCITLHIPSCHMLSKALFEVYEVNEEFPVVFYAFFKYLSNNVRSCSILLLPGLNPAYSSPSVINL